MQLQLFFIFVFVIMVNAQRKPGDCPPAIEGTCFMRCYRDTECSGPLKCCRTSCGGSTCSAPITSRPVEVLNGERPGSCPAKPSGAWVCSSRCSIDEECPPTFKCCKNRCGAMACTKPE